MKKIYLFLIFLILTGCESKMLNQISVIPTDCPNLLFSKEHKIYMESEQEDVSLDNIAYKAEINNAEFVKGCGIKNNFFSSNLSLLFIITPLNKNQENIILPYYIAIIDEDNNLQDIQYYSAKGNFKKNIETGTFLETELKTTITINNNLVNKQSKLVLGFMLDKKRLILLN